MKKKVLTKQILMVLAMSAVVCTNGMAETLEPIKVGNEDITNTTKGTYEINTDQVGILQTSSGSGDLTMTSQGNTITTTGEDKAAIQVNGSGTFVLNANSGKNSLFSELNDGISSNNGLSGGITLTGSGNEISAGKDGISTDGTNITLRATGEAGNVIRAGENGITADGGVVNLIGKDNIIKVEGTSTAGINATNGAQVNINNTTDEAKPENAENTEIHVTENGKFASYGIHADTGSAVDIDSDKVTITVDKTNEEYKNEGTVGGIFVNTATNAASSAYSSVNIHTKNDIDINVQNVGAVGTGISAQGKSSLDLTSDEGSISIGLQLGAPDATNGNAYGVHAERGANITLDANKDVNIMTTSQVAEATNGSRTVTGMWANDDSSIIVTTGGMLTINSQDKNSDNNGLRAQQGGNIFVTTNGTDANGTGIYINSIGRDSYALSAQDGNIDLSAHGDIVLNSSGTRNSMGVINSSTMTKTSTILNANGNDIQISAYTDAEDTNYRAYGLRNASMIADSIMNMSGKNISISAISEQTPAYGINAENSGTNKNEVTIIANNANIVADSKGNAYGLFSVSSDININATNSAVVNSSQYGIYAYGGIYSNPTDIQLQSGMDNFVYGKSTGVYARGEDSLVELTADKGVNILQSIDGIVIRGESGAKAKLKATNAYNVVLGNSTAIYSSGIGTNIQLKAKGNNVLGSTGLWGLVNGEITLHASTQNNEVSASNTYGVYGDSFSNLNLTADVGSNILKAGNVDENGFGYGQAVFARAGSTVNMTAGDTNALSGAVNAIGMNTTVKMNGTDNNVYSAATISNAGDLNTDESFVGKSVISALYAEDGAEISVSGTQNVFLTYADNTNEKQLERVLWAYNGADIDVDGETRISTDRYSTSPNSADIAIAAGTATGLENLDKTEIENFQGDRAVVTLNYDGSSSITGDILAAYAGEVDINTKSENAGLTVTGNILAGNNGVLNLDLGNGGVLTGRADDYGDAVDAHVTFFNPAFSSTIYTGGEVNLNMGQGSVWDVTGQSWLTSLTGNGGTIDMRNSTANNMTSHAVHVGTITGNHTFVMDLNRNDHKISDMLYIKDPNASAGEQTVFINSLAGVEDMADGEKLRFATVNAATDKLSFTGTYHGEQGYDKSRVMMRDIGVMDMNLRIENEDYATSDTENNEYNGTSFDKTKPGEEYVDGNYADGTNWYLTRDSSGDELSDAGKTVIAMSKVNYSNAVYMDRLNKRMGEARYIDGDDGLWVRLRHDRIGKDDAFRSRNTMFELGYDWHAKGQKDGEHRQGVAFDYMRGTADYQNVAGDGDVRRAGVWLYDTWLGDKGHYSDYVVKYGRLSNDFDIYSELGEKIDGDYDNDVWSVSAEYGRKKDIGNEWYFEPQVQAQYAYVTSADYTTSQGTKVELDGIDSLIGRAGFRLGRDTSEGNTVYFKADILHEFLGDQSIRAMDDTGVLSTTYENEGTWYDVGFGFSHRMGEDSYLFLDVEHSFGNDNEDTYQVNIGLNRAF